MAKSNRLSLLQLLLLVALAKSQPSDNATRASSGFGLSLSDTTNDNTERAADGTSPPTPVPINLSNEFLGIPGTTQTTNGYDTALGNDPICWIGFTNDNSTNSSSESVMSSQAALDLVKQVFPNPLVSDFVFVETRILSECPTNNSVTIETPQEAQRGERLRTLQDYNYTLHVELDLDTLEYGDELITDNGDDIVALQVVVCSLGKSGFCSPFVHEQGTYLADSARLRMI